MIYSLIILSAPSGSGKTTIRNYLMQKRSDLAFSVSATTRAMRKGEQEGVDYYYLSVDEFLKKRESGDFVEWEEVYEGLFYGTLKSEIERLWGLGKHVIFDVDVVGGINLKLLYPEQSCDIFIQTPSLEELEKRLVQRHTESEDKIAMRLAKAKREIIYAKDFTYVVLNDDLEAAQKEVEDIIDAFIKNLNA